MSSSVRSRCVTARRNPGRIVREIATTPEVDADRIRTMVENAGHSYPELIALADGALGRASLRAGKELGIKAAELPPHTLLQIAQMAKLEAKHAAQRRGAK